ncbi:MAG: hypothetical protein R2851_19265 [Caldilineaceae bacterium]
MDNVPVTDELQAAFLSGTCIACHVIPGIPSAVGQIGPDLTHIGTTAATRVPGERPGVHPPVDRRPHRLHRARLSHRAVHHRHHAAGPGYAGQPRGPQLDDQLPGRLGVIGFTPQRRVQRPA